MKTSRFIPGAMLLASAFLSANAAAQSRGGQPTMIPTGRIPPSSSARPPVGSATRRNNPPPRARGFSLDSAVVESDEVRLVLTALPDVWQYKLKGTRGYFSWRVDVNDGEGLGIVLAADTTMSETNYVRRVNGSTLRRCANPRQTSARKCTIPLKEEVRARDDAVLFVLKDPGIVRYFRGIRPTHLYGSTFEPKGRFRVDLIPIAYHDGIKTLRVPTIILKK